MPERPVASQRKGGTLAWLSVMFVMRAAVPVSQPTNHLSPLTTPAPVGRRGRFGSGVFGGTGLGGCGTGVGRVGTGPGIGSVGTGNGGCSGGTGTSGGTLGVLSALILVLVLERCADFKDDLWLSNKVMDDFLLGDVEPNSRERARGS
jgi:hypothetical protein